MGDHGKAAPGFAGARCLDCRVQRQQIGLRGDRLDQIEHAVDALGRRGEAFDFADGFFGSQAGLFDDPRRLADLTADLLHGSRQFLGRAGDRVDVAGSLLRSAGGGDGASAGVRRRLGDRLRGIAHRRCIVGDRAQHAADRLAERLYRSFDAPGPLLPCLGILQDLRIEIAVAVHRLLEDPDRARQCADLVSPVDMRHHDVLGTFRDLLDGGGDGRKRPRDRAGNDQDADADHDQRKAAEAGQQKGQQVMDLALLRELLAAFGIDLGKLVEVCVEGGADLAVGIIVAPLAAGGRTDLHAAANQFLAELDELFDPLLEGGELLGVVGPDNGLPAPDHVEDLGVELEQPVAELLGGGRVGRHVDAAGFHHDGIDQRIDVLDIERGPARGLDGLREFGVAAGIVVGQHRHRRGQNRDQRKDRIQPGGDRKSGRCGGAGST